MFTAFGQQHFSRHRLAAVGVLILSALLFFSRLGERSLWSEEVRWAEIPREMLRAGDPWWPTFNGRVYYDKPLGSYWLVLAAGLITGGPNEWAARLPSAVSGLVAVALLMLIGRRLYGPQVGTLAGAILATSFGFTGFARTAAADAENVAGILAALWLFVHNDGRPGRWLYLFWLAMALTSSTKGLLGFALPLLVVGVYSTWAGLADRGCSRGLLERVIAANRWFFGRTTLMAAPMALGIYLAPFLMSHQSGGALEGLGMVYRENVRRFFNPVNHRGPAYLYVSVLFELFAPWSVFLPAVFLGAMSTALGGHGFSTAPARTKPSGNPLAGRWHPGRQNRFAWVYFISVFSFFTLSSSRRSYYLLPVLPAAALLVANLLASRERGRPEDSQSSGGPRSRLAAMIAFGAAILIAPVALLPPSLRPEPLDQWPSLPASGAFIAAWVVSILALAMTAIRRRTPAIGFAISGFAFQAYLFVFAVPAADEYRTQRPFASAVREHLGFNLAGLSLYRTSEIVYYLDPPGPLGELREPAEAVDFAAEGGPKWLISRRRDRDTLKDGWAEVLSERSHPWESAEQVKSKLLLLRSTR